MREGGERPLQQLDDADGMRGSDCIAEEADIAVITRETCSPSEGMSADASIASSAAESPREQ
jgi:hypothetical protein